MSAVPEDFMSERPRMRVDDASSDKSPRDDAGSMQGFWQWFAVGVLVFCWIAEATLCAQRGF
jgi:hypothetical protein